MNNLRQGCVFIFETTENYLETANLAIDKFYIITKREKQ